MIIEFIDETNNGMDTEYRKIYDLNFIHKVTILI